MENSNDVYIKATVSGKVRLALYNEDIELYGVFIWRS